MPPAHIHIILGGLTFAYADFCFSRANVLHAVIFIQWTVYFLLYEHCKYHLVHDVIKLNEI